jgi:hypothetical protein
MVDSRLPRVIYTGFYVTCRISDKTEDLIFVFDRHCPSRFFRDETRNKIYSQGAVVEEALRVKITCEG